MHPTNPSLRQRIVVVGGGAGGVELALSMQARLMKDLIAAGRSTDGVQVTLVSRSTQLMPQHATATRTTFEKILVERGVNLLLGKSVVSATAGELVCADDSRVAFDEAVW